jgi:hypothetical protein
MSVCSVSESPDQCKFCGEVIPAGDRRPPEYCSNAHRQADYRKRRQEAANGSEPADRAEGHPADLNAPTTESAETGAENSNKINGPNFVTNGSSVPLDLFGRGHRWVGVKADGNAAKVTAAIDAELGVGVEWLTSPGGARYQVIPSRHAR